MYCKINTLFFILCLILFSSVSAAYSQEIREESSLNYTYIGPVFSYSQNTASYRDWVENETKTVNVSGNSYTGGVDLKILAHSMCGDFQAKYSYSSYDTTLTCLEFLLAGIYLYRINDFFSVGGGIGLYMETPPSSNGHNGSAGLYIPVSTMFETTADTRFFIDIFGKYGSFGLGEDTEFSAFGCSMGFIYKVGRI